MYLRIFTVNVINLTRERTFFLWSIIGPLLASVTVLLMVYHATPITPYLGLIMVLGLPTCWYLKKWGVILTSFLLTSVLFFNADTISGDLFWHIGVVASMVITLFVTNNSYDEAVELIEALSGTSVATQETIEQMRADLEAARFKHQSEIQSLQKKVEGFFLEIKSEQEKSHLLNEDAERAHQETQKYKLEVDKSKNDLDILRHDLESKTIKEEHLLQESLEQRREILLLRDQLLEIQHELKNSPAQHTSLSNKEDNEQQTLREMLGKNEQDLFNIQFRLDSALDDYKEQEKELIKLQDQDDVQKKIQHEMSDQIEILRREKDLLEKTLNKLQDETEHLVKLKTEKEDLQKAFDLLITEKNQLLEVSAEKDRLKSIIKKMEVDAIQINEIKKEKDSLEKTVNQLLDELKNFHSIKNEKNRLEKALLQLNAEKEYLLKNQSDKEHLQESLQKLEQNVELADEIKREKEHLEKTVHQLHHKLEAANKEKDQLIVTVNKLLKDSEHFSSIKNEKERLEHSLKTLKEQLSNASHHMQETPKANHEDLKQEIALRRRAEAMYLQLKDQFNQKAATLDETRKELFITQENLTQIQLNMKEYDQFNPHPEVQSLVKHLVKIQDNMDKDRQSYHSEIDVLQEIITQLSKGSKSP